VAAAVLFGGMARAGQRRDCASNARQLAVAMLLYTQDYDERLPPMVDTAKVQAVLLPYVKDRIVFNCVVGGKPFHWNRAISAMPLSQIKNPAQTVLLYDDAPHDGTRVVGFVDGHVVRMREEQFAALVKAKAVQ